MSNEYLLVKNILYMYRVTRLCRKKKQFLPFKKPFPNGCLLLCPYLNYYRSVQV